MGLCQRYKDVYFYLSHPTNDSLLEGFFIPFFFLGCGCWDSIFNSLEGYLILLQCLMDPFPGTSCVDL